MVAAYLPDQRLDTTGTTVNLVKGDLANDLATVFSGVMSMDIAVSAEVQVRTCGAS